MGNKRNINQTNLLGKAGLLPTSFTSLDMLCNDLGDHPLVAQSSAELHELVHRMQNDTHEHLPTWKAIVISITRFIALNPEIRKHLLNQERLGGTYFSAADYIQHFVAYKLNGYVFSWDPNLGTFLTYIRSNFEYSLKNNRKLAYQATNAYPKLHKKIQTHLLEIKLQETDRKIQKEYEEVCSFEVVERESTDLELSYFEKKLIEFVFIPLEPLVAEYWDQESDEQASMEYAMSELESTYLRPPIDDLSALSELFSLPTPDKEESDYHLATQESLTIRLNHLMKNLLTLRQQEVMNYCFGLNGCPALFLDEIGEKYGLTAERVRQIRNKAILKLRDHKIFF